MNQKVIWVSQIPPSKDKENNIRECFIAEEIDFKYPNNIDEFDDLLTIFKDKKKHTMKIIQKEIIKRDRLIVMNDVSDLADKLETFAIF